MRERLHRINLTIPADIHSVERVRLALNGMATRQGVAPKVTARLQIVLDELLSNTIQHGYPDGPPKDEQAIAVAMSLEDSEFHLTLTDRGAPFDPSQPVFGDGKARPRIGGRGLDMVAALSDRVSYARHGSENQTTITKAVTFAREETGHMVPGLTIEEERGEDAATVALAGRIDSGNAPQLTDLLNEIIQAGHKEIRLDLEKLDYLTSAGFRTLLVVSDAAEEIGGGLVLSNLSEQVQELFDLSGLTRAFEIKA